MCRALSDHGGRRCPCSQPEYRNAYRRATYQARRLAGSNPVDAGAIETEETSTALAEALATTPARGDTTIALPEVETAARHFAGRLGYRYVDASTAAEHPGTTTEPGVLWVQSFDGGETWLLQSQGRDGHPEHPLGRKPLAPAALVEAIRSLQTRGADSSVPGTETDRPSRQERTEQAHAELVAAVERIATSDDWRAFLDFSRQLPTYSANNVCWLMAQAARREWDPLDHVAGYRAWQAMGRQVQRGETGLKVLAPCRYKVKDADTGEDKWVVRGFTTATVFAARRPTARARCPHRRRRRSSAAKVRTLSVIPEGALNVKSVARRATRFVPGR